MKKIVLAVMLLGTLAAVLTGTAHEPDSNQKANTFKVRHIPLTQEFIQAGTPIIDIRTQQEWKETGIVPGSHLLTFFSEDGSHDEQGFIKRLQQIADPDTPLAILCRSGNRSEKVSRFLAGQGFRSVIDIYEGIKGGIARGVTLEPYTDTFNPKEVKP
ncbi:MAG: rhodanese-like domain-containing protein [Desulfuromonadales bacterium]|nr:rhodanese-like domain-containing protein [Desulfuromonadales bacterium]MDW7756723.1 rhodanese-like domain-containing protein [Desulfuromonadales bacterium]